MDLVNIIERQRRDSDNLNAFELARKGGGRADWPQRDLRGEAGLSKLYHRLSRVMHACVTAGLGWSGLTDWRTDRQTGTGTGQSSRGPADKDVLPAVPAAVALSYAGRVVPPATFAGRRKLSPLSHIRWASGGTSRSRRHRYAVGCGIRTVAWLPVFTTFSVAPEEICILVSFWLKVFCNYPDS